MDISEKELIVNLLKVLDLDEVIKIVFRDTSGYWWTKHLNCKSSFVELIRSMRAHAPPQLD